MLKATNEERGMVAGLAALSQDLEEEHVDSTYNSTSVQGYTIGYHHCQVQFHML